MVEALSQKGEWTFLTLEDLTGDGVVELLRAHEDQLIIATYQGKVWQWDFETSFPDPIRRLEILDLDQRKGTELYFVTAPARIGKKETGTFELFRCNWDEKQKAFLVQSILKEEIQNAFQLTLRSWGAPGSTPFLLAAFCPPGETSSMEQLTWGEETLSRKAIAEEIKSGRSWAIGELDLRNNSPEILVGSFYGDKTQSWGNAFFMIQEGDVHPLPAHRGVGAIAVGDYEGDGSPEIFLGDGCHPDYGRVSRGRVAWLSHVGNTWQYQGVIEDIPYVPWFSEMKAVDMNGDGASELIVTGLRLAGKPVVRTYRQLEGHWEAAWLQEDVTAYALLSTEDEAPPHFLVCRGGKTEIVKWETLPWSTELGPEVKTPDWKPDPKTLVGQPAPKLDIGKWLVGEGPTSLEALKGKVVLLDFWSTVGWHSTAPLAMGKKFEPEFPAWYKRYREKGLVILGITALSEWQEKESNLTDFLRGETLPYPIGLCRETFTWLDYGIGSLPHYYVIDKAGVIRFQKQGGLPQAELETVLEPLLIEKK
jgi:hypothetical protein